MKYVENIKFVVKYAVKMHLKFVIKKPEWYVLSLCFICIAYELKSLNLFFLDLLLTGIIMNKSIS